MRMGFVSLILVAILACAGTDFRFANDAIETSDGSGLPDPGRPAPFATPAVCGDKVCVFGEFCARCPSDCDCGTLAATPPMGWNTWNRFGCDIDETLVLEMADALVSSGMRDAGYAYLNLDDCWQASRDATGEIVADPMRFPSGIRALADQVHARGLKFGLYTCAGTQTCQGRPGSAGHDAQDAKTYAAWGVDFIKEDWCFTEGMDPYDRYRAMHEAIEATGRPMLLSLCNWGRNAPWIWGPSVGQMWRTTGDIADVFLSMYANIDATAPLAAYAGPGHWNDPDMLEVGNGGMTPDQYRSQVSLWSIAAAPLIAGNDLRAMDEATVALLTNPEVIAVDQDPTGLQGVRLSNEDVEVWARPVTGEGLRAVVLFNRTFDPATGAVTFVDLGLSGARARVRDLWERKDLGEFTDSFSTLVPAGGSVMLLVAGTEPVPPPGETYLSDLPWMYAANGKGPVLRDRSPGGPISVNGYHASKGLGTVAPSVLLYHLGGRCTRLQAIAAVDSGGGDKNVAAFEVRADGEVLFRSSMGNYTHGHALDLDISDRHVLTLYVDAGMEAAADDWADWADARVICE